MRAQVGACSKVDARTFRSSHQHFVPATSILSSKEAKVLVVAGCCCGRPGASVAAIWLGAEASVLSVAEEARESNADVVVGPEASVGSMLNPGASVLSAVASVVAFSVSTAAVVVLIALDSVVVGVSVVVMSNSASIMAASVAVAMAVEVVLIVEAKMKCTNQRERGKCRR